jgi:hypothetical protein
MTDTGDLPEVKNGNGTQGTVQGATEGRNGTIRAQLGREGEGPTSGPVGRHRLPIRREHESFTFTHAGIRYTAGVCRFEDGRLGEIVLNGSKTGTDSDTSARDAAIVVSIALQSGVASNTIRHALTRNRDGSASGPLGVALDKLAADSSKAGGERPD